MIIGHHPRTCREPGSLPSRRSFCSQIRLRSMDDSRQLGTAGRAITAAFGRLDNREARRRFGMAF
jgi:hypothetical protein